MRILYAEDLRAGGHFSRGQGPRGRSCRRRRGGAAALAAYMAGVYDLVLMDVEIPVMDGVSATRQMRAGKQARWTPIVLLTARTERRNPRRLRPGADDYLSKPIDFDALEAHLQAMQPS